MWCILKRDVLLFFSGAKATYYLPNSFTQYLVKSAKKRRELVPAPVSITNEYYTNIALQVKVDANSSNCVVFLSTNSLGTEFNRIDVSTVFFQAVSHQIVCIYTSIDPAKIRSNLSKGPFLFIL